MIREAKVTDLQDIMRITKEIVMEMKNDGNPQWHDNYPTIEDFSQDINNQTLYVYEENNKVIAFICITKDYDNEYESVLQSTKEDAYIMHRLGVDKSYRSSGIASILMSYAEELAQKDNVYLMKTDTEVNNLKMNRLFTKLGYKKVSNLTWSDNDGLFNYYEKRLKDHE